MNVMMNNLSNGGAQLPNLPHDDDDMSDISEEDDYQHGNNGGLVDPRKKNRILWTTDKEEYLLRCYNHYRLTSSSEHGLKGKSWRRIAFRMTNQFGEEYDSKSCRNKLNVLRYDYLSFKEILDAKASGKDTDNFWHAITEKYPRSSRWRDSDYPHADLMGKILDLNGGMFIVGPLCLSNFALNVDGVDPIPESDAENQMMSKTPAKKRLRDSFGVGVSASSPKQRRQSTSSAIRSDGTPEEILAKVLDKIRQGFGEILDELKKRPETIVDPRKIAMEELNKDRYLILLSDAKSRELLFNVFKDGNIAKDFVYYPDAFKLNFLQDILVKHSNNDGGAHN